MKKGRLKEIVSELQGASKMHLKQSKEIAEHIDDMKTPLKFKGANSSNSSCWDGYKKEIRKTTKGKGRNFRSAEEGAGMTSKGVSEYKKKNPGSNLQTAVTGDVKPGGKAAKRRKSFCARSKGWTGERGKAARARWKC